ncbi:MAG: hypothetical protein HYW23_00450 [Candidatus Aenigmarchaeota archaeon]|nr:hypothetical protein [Candidatus Aenigmarchaeota archaeon]
MKWNKIILIAIGLVILLYALLNLVQFNRNKFDVTYEHLDNSDNVVRILENTNVNFDSSSKELQITGKNATIRINYTSETIFRVWQLKIIENGNQTYLEERPDVSDLKKNDKQLYIFSHEIKLSENDSNVTVKFSVQNVGELRSKYLYPFDAYYPFDESKSITNNIIIIGHYIFPETDIKQNVEAIAKTPSGEILCQTPSGYSHYKGFVFTAKPTPIQFDHQLITADVGLRNNEFYGISFSLYQTLPNGIVVPIKNCKFDAGGNLTESVKINFHRTLFPSEFLFFLAIILILGVIGKYGSLEHYREYGFRKTLYDMYIIALTPTVIAEFTVSLLPPSRPLTFTLFDFIFLIPFLWTVKNYLKSRFPNVL